MMHEARLGESYSHKSGCGILVFIQKFAWCPRALPSPGAVGQGATTEADAPADPSLQVGESRFKVFSEDPCEIKRERTARTPR